MKILMLLVCSRFVVVVDHPEHRPKENARSNVTDHCCLRLVSTRRLEMRNHRRLNKKESGLRNYVRVARHRVVLLLSFIAVACCTVLAFTAWAHNRRVLARTDISRALSPQAQTSSIPNLPGSGSSIERMDIEVITIRPTGFERTEITRPKGLFGIAVENRSGLTDVVLRLDQANGPRLREAQLSMRNLSWKDRFDLVPGRYVLTEASHPDWKCVITMTE